jgi:hypothetical protein
MPVATVRTTVAVPVGRAAAETGLDGVAGLLGLLFVVVAGVLLEVAGGGEAEADVAVGLVPRVPDGAGTSDVQPTPSALTAAATATATALRVRSDIGHLRSRR